MENICVSHQTAVGTPAVHPNTWMIRTKYFDANTEGVSRWAYLAAFIRLRGTHLRLDIVLETVDALAVPFFFAQV
jgi:hypothetical protein